MELTIKPTNDRHYNPKRSWFCNAFLNLCRFLISLGKKFGFKKQDARNTSIYKVLNAIEDLRHLPKNNKFLVAKVA